MDAIRPDQPMLSFEAFLALLPGVNVSEGRKDFEERLSSARHAGRNLQIGDVTMSMAEVSSYFDDCESLTHVTPLGAIRLAQLYRRGFLPGLEAHPLPVPESVLLYAEGRSPSALYLVEHELLADWHRQS